MFASSRACTRPSSGSQPGWCAGSLPRTRCRRRVAPVRSGARRRRPRGQRRCRSRADRSGRGRCSDRALSRRREWPGGSCRNPFRARTSWSQSQSAPRRTGTASGRWRGAGAPRGGRVWEAARDARAGRPTARPCGQQRLAEHVRAVGRLDVVDDVLAFAVGDAEGLGGGWFANAVVVVVGPDDPPSKAGLAGIAHAVRVEVVELRAGGRARARDELVWRDVVLHVRLLRRGRARVHPHGGEREALVMPSASSRIWLRLSAASPNRSIRHRSLVVARKPARDHRPLMAPCTSTFGVRPVSPSRRPRVAQPVAKVGRRRLIHRWSTTSTPLP